MKFTLICTTTALALMTVGCATHGKDLVSTGRVHVEHIDTDQVTLLPPSVKLNGDVTELRGVVQRKPGYDGPVDGHVQIQILDASGALVDEFPLNWEPDPIPTTGKRQAQYELSYGLTPPQGATVRVSISDVTGNESYAGGGGGGSGGPRTAGNPAQLPTHLRTPGTTGSPRSGMAPSTPGTPHQRSSAPRTPGGGRGHR
jgi:hypothetical protein